MLHRLFSFQSQEFSRSSQLGQAEFTLAYRKLTKIASSRPLTRPNPNTACPTSGRRNRWSNHIEDKKRTHAVVGEALPHLGEKQVRLLPPESIPRKCLCNQGAIFLVPGHDSRDNIVRRGIFQRASPGSNRQETLPGNNLIS